MLIEIYGLGCNTCERLLEHAQSAVDELGIEAQIIKVEDFETIIRKGITRTPGLVIDGEIRSMGRVPSVEEIKEMIGSAITRKTAPSDPKIEVIAPSCGCSGKGAAFYPCSGGSNVGQMSNEVAKSLVDLGLGKFSCLAGVGSHGTGFINAAGRADKVVSIDGCGARCATKTLRHAGIEPTVHVVITDLGMKKDYDRLNPGREDVERIASRVQELL